jgi:uncharacterized SAM-binding protein YcdF (DUF218 family)
MPWDGNNRKDGTQALKSIKFWAVIAIPLFIFLGQLTYFYWIYHEKPIIPEKVEMVLIYSGAEDREDAARFWGQLPNSPLLLFSGQGYSPIILSKELGISQNRILVEGRAKTTDQNARYCAPIIGQLKVHSVLLALPWYHLPRALFLTRYYLLGSGITVKPYATIPLPPGWFFNHWFWEELFKFWGSLGRIVLSWFGIEDWPHHFDS